MTDVGITLAVGGYLYLVVVYSMKVSRMVDQVDMTS